MKKLIIGILAVCLLIGIPFILMDVIATGNGPFNIPSGFKKIKVDLKEKERNNEVVLTKEIKNATVVCFMVQSDSDTNSTVRILSDKKFIGSNAVEEKFEVKSLTGKSYMSPTFMLQPGHFSITVTNVITDGNLMIGYKEKEIEASEYERLLKIDRGDLNNPPEGYELLYSSDLSGLEKNQEIIDTITLDHTQKIGISVYTNSTKGNVSVDFIGKYSSFYGLVTPKVRYICDRMENTLQAGDYDIQLTCKDADGQIYIFIKK
jgi:hypothetical protein